MESYDAEYEIQLLHFPGWEETNGLYETTPYILPEPVIFEGYFDALRDTDYPVNNVDWPIMSRRMYYTLTTVGDFSHRVIPVAIIDDTSFISEPDRRLLADGIPNPEVTNFSDFVAVQLLQESNYFDFEQSKYTRHPRDPEWINAVEKYVLIEPSKGFPPLFRLAVTSPKLFISAEARRALREADIRGTAYYTLDDGYAVHLEVDNPVSV
jgi:hypothetical protein